MHACRYNYTIRVQSYAYSREQQCCICRPIDHCRTYVLASISGNARACQCRIIAAVMLPNSETPPHCASHSLARLTVVYNHGGKAAAAARPLTHSISYQCHWRRDSIAAAGAGAHSSKQKLCRACNSASECVRADRICRRCSSWETTYVRSDTS
ncbi:hypothetical protein D1007_46781 [Hordeum vulgare]|nr:hypothetical protein D1007_46781 [Hordeum vulgare]